MQESVIYRSIQRDVKLAIALNFLREGLSVEIVARGTGLSIEEVQQLQEQSNPWVKFAGMFKDDPLFDEFVEDMAKYRRELDAEMTCF